MATNPSSLLFLQYLTTVFDNIRDAIMLIGVEPDHTYRLLMVNAAFVINTGHSKDSEGKLVSEIVSPDSYRALRPRYDKVVATRKAVEYTEWYDVPLGPQAYEVKIIPILNAVGECVQLAVITYNVTNLHKLREEVSKLRAKDKTAAKK
jgi:hypothetical protein